MTILKLVSCYKSTPDPGKILMTPLGNPALAASSANFRAVIGVTCKMNYKSIFICHLLRGQQIILLNSCNHLSESTNYIKWFKKLEKCAKLDMQGQLMWWPFKVRQHLSLDPMIKWRTPYRTIKKGWARMCGWRGSRGRGLASRR